LVREISMNTSRRLICICLRNRGVKRGAITVWSTFPPSSPFWGRRDCVHHQATHWSIHGFELVPPRVHRQSLIGSSTRTHRNLLELMVKRLVLFAVMVSLFVLNVVPLSAQFETASVLGYVRDGSGSVVAGATVSLINKGTKVQVTVQTDAQGSYQFTDVKIGQYRVSVQALGFGTSDTAPFTVTVNARQRVDVTLKVGASTEVVTVTSAAELLETDSSERAQVIGTREVENLPLNGRSYADLAALVPGVRRNTLENSTDSSRDASFNVNGQRSEFNNFLLDGLDNNAYGTSNQGFSNQAIPPRPMQLTNSAYRRTTTAPNTAAPRAPSLTSASAAVRTISTVRLTTTSATLYLMPSVPSPHQPTHLPASRKNQY
jgi:hypothetical protein